MPGLNQNRDIKESIIHYYVIFEMLKKYQKIKLLLAIRENQPDRTAISVLKGGFGEFNCQFWKAGELKRRN